MIQRSLPVLCALVLLALLLAPVPARAGAQAKPRPAPATKTVAPPAAKTDAPPAEKPDAPVAEPEENLLAEPEEPSLPPPDEKPSGERGAHESFGTELSLLNLEATWSGYGDVTFMMQRGTPASFDAAHFNPILTARMGSRLTAEAEVEIEPEELGVEYTILDIAISRSLTLRLGKFLVPFGRFNEVLHPSFRWNMVSKPLMMDEVVPTTWVDIGIQARGTVDLGGGNAVSYAAWVTNGLGGGEDFKDQPQVVKSLRDNYDDNNSDKALGARLAFDLFRGQRFGSSTIGFSAYTAAVNDAASERLSLVGVDASLGLGDVTLRGEAVQSFLGTQGSPLELFERGVYTQVSYKLGRADVSGRWDYVLLRPGNAEATTRHQVVVGASYSPLDFLILRIEGAFAVASAEGTPPRFGAMTAFSF